MLAVAAKHLGQPVVPGRREVDRDGGVVAVDPLLRDPDLAPARVISDHEHRGKPETHERVELEAVQPERPVARDDDHLLVRLRGLDPERVGRPDAEAAERAGIQPMPRPVHAQHPRDGCHDVAAVPDHDRPRIEHLVEDLPEPVMVQGRGLRLDLRAVGLPPGGLRLAQPLEPGVVRPSRLDAVRQDPQHRRAVADDPRVRRAVAPELPRVAVDVHELRVAEAPELEPEVERRPDDANDVGRLERGAARVLEEELVVGRERPATRAVQIDGQPSVLGEQAELLPGAVPPDPAAGDHHRPLGACQ